VSTKTVWLAASAMVLAICVAPFALAAGENTPVKGGARNPSPNASQAYTKETQIIANTSTYGTRQSNKSDNGGGAIYGCRSKAGGSPKANEPCVRASNLADGRVEVIAEGSRDHCQRLLSALRSGESPGSVEHVAERWSDPKGGLSGFVER